jgi:cell division protein WhiA
MAAGSFTEEVRQQLAGLPLGGDRRVHAELAALVRLAGSLTVAGEGRLGLEVSTGSGAVARRAFQLVQHRYGSRPELLVRAPGGVRRRSTYAVRLGTGAEQVARDLGILDPDGRLVDGVLPDLTGTRVVAYVRGALLAAGSISAPDRPPHLEIGCGSEAVAGGLERLVEQVVDGHVTVTGGSRPRVVLKSGERIGQLLVATGATSAFLRWDERRMRRQARSDAVRLSNADEANVRRVVADAAPQVAAAAALLDSELWDTLADDLRDVARARLANPEVSLTELGMLVTPPLTRSAVYRRLRRLQQLATELPGSGGTRPGDP